MKKDFNKLVRDKIPQIIQKTGRQCQVEVMGVEEYKKALLEKLVEEAIEVTHSRVKTELIRELADIYEVIEAIKRAFTIPEEEVKALQIQKKEKRDGFDRQLKLIWAEDTI